MGPRANGPTAPKKYIFSYFLLTAADRPWYTRATFSKRHLQPVHGSRRLPKPSLADNAHRQIKEWVVRYHLKPGTRLQVSDLACALHMSQTPVREALSMLEKEHLIEREPQKGFRVSTLNTQGVEDLYDLRIALEVLAAQQAA